jgi:hypothetical protein
MIGIPLLSLILPAEFIVLYGSYLYVPCSFCSLTKRILYVAEVSLHARLVDYPQ